MDCRCCANYNPKQTHEQFHVDRIRRILESGKGKAVVPKNHWSKDKLTYTTIKGKVERIMASLYELGIHETFLDCQIDKINWE